MRRRAASLLFAGSANAPTRVAAAAMASAAVPAPQSLPTAREALPLKTSRRALARAPLTPKLPSVGPIARTRTGLDLSPEITKPTMREPAAVPVWLRVEMLKNRSVSARASLFAPTKVRAAPAAGVTLTLIAAVAAWTVPTMRALLSVVPLRAPEALTVPLPPSAVVPLTVMTKASPAAPMIV